MTEIYLHIDARMADYMATHPYSPTRELWRDILCSALDPVFPPHHVPFLRLAMTIFCRRGKRSDRRRLLDHQAR